MSKTSTASTASTTSTTSTAQPDTARPAREFTWDVSDFDNWKAEQFPQGCIAIESGNSLQYLTGGWRSNRPVWAQDKCKNCMFCWISCPDSSILVADGEMIGIDYDHCKGCGICVTECPFDALSMVSENEAKGA